MLLLLNVFSAYQLYVDGTVN